MDPSIETQPNPCSPLDHRGPSKPSMDRSEPRTRIDIVVARWPSTNYQAIRRVHRIGWQREEQQRVRRIDRPRRSSISDDSRGINDPAATVSTSLSAAPSVILARLRRGASRKQSVLRAFYARASQIRWNVHGSRRSVPLVISGRPGARV